MVRTEQEKLVHTAGHFNLRTCLEILERTPSVLKTLLADLSTDWTRPLDDQEQDIQNILHYLILNEQDTWIPNLKSVLEGHGASLVELYEKLLPTEETRSKPVNALLKEFKLLRELNVGEIRRLQSEFSDLNRKEDFSIWGKISVKELMASWMIHDLSHISKISKLMANRFEAEVGIYSQHLDILKY